MVYAFPNFNWNSLSGGILKSITEKDGKVEIFIQSEVSKFFIGFNGVYFKTINVKMEDSIVSASLGTSLGFQALSKLREEGKPMDDYITIRLNLSGTNSVITCAVKDLRIVELK